MQQPAYSEAQMADRFLRLLRSRKGIPGLGRFTSVFREVDCIRGRADFLAVATPFSGASDKIELPFISIHTWRSREAAVAEHDQARWNRLVCPRQSQSHVQGAALGFRAQDREHEKSYLPGSAVSCTRQQGHDCRPS